MQPLPEPLLVLLLLFLLGTVAFLASLFCGFVCLLLLIFGPVALLAGLLGGLLGSKAGQPGVLGVLPCPVLRIFGVARLGQRSQPA